MAEMENEAVVELISRYKNELRDLMSVNVPVPLMEQKAAGSFPISILYDGNAVKAIDDLCAIYEAYQKWYEGTSSEKQESSPRPSAILGNLGMLYDHRDLFQNDGKEFCKSLDSFIQNSLADFIAASQACGRSKSVKWIYTYATGRNVVKKPQSDTMSSSRDSEKVKKAEENARSQADKKPEGLQRLTSFFVYILMGAYEKDLRSYFNSDEDIAHMHDALYSDCLQTKQDASLLHSFWNSIDQHRMPGAYYCRAFAVVQSFGTGKTCLALALQRSLFIFTFTFSSLFGDIDSAPDPDLDVCHFIKMQSALFGSHTVVASLLSALWDELSLLVGLNLVDAGVKQPENDFLQFQLDYEDMANHNLASSVPSTEEKIQQRAVVEQSQKRLSTLEKVLALEGKLTKARFLELQASDSEMATLKIPAVVTPVSLQEHICPLVIALRQVAGGNKCRSNRRDFLARVIRLAMAKLRSLPYRFAKEDPEYLNDIGLVASIKRLFALLDATKDSCTPSDKPTQIMLGLDNCHYLDDLLPARKRWNKETIFVQFGCFSSGAPREDAKGIWTFMEIFHELKMMAKKDDFNDPLHRVWVMPITSHPSIFRRPNETAQEEDVSEEDEYGNPLPAIMMLN